MTNFWKNLKRPIFCLAPMADVTDCAFRQIIAKYSGDTRPTEQSFGLVFWTEFVSADGLAHPIARKKLLIDLKYSENERPIIAQIFGANPDNIRTASALCKELGFDGIDINMGCPDKSVEKQSAGAALMKNPKLAREIIRAAVEGAGGPASTRGGSSTRGGLPVSVKTRIGYNRNEIETWIPELLKENLAALTVHLRTRKEMSDVPAHWDLMKRIVEIRDETTTASGGARSKTLIIGNGDVLDLEDARQKIKETGCDGVMLGKAIFGNPWLFDKSLLMKSDNQLINTDKQIGVDQKTISVNQRLAVLVEHTKLFEKLLGKHKNFAVMKKHYKAYVSGLNRAKELRMKLMETENAGQVENIVNDFLLKIE